MFCTYKTVLPLQALLNQLRAVFDQIIELQNTQDAIYRAALEELQKRLQFEEKKKQREIEVWFYTGGFVNLINEFIVIIITNTTNNVPAEMFVKLRLCSHLES